MKKIIVWYWKGVPLIPTFEYENEFEYSIENRDEIIGIILAHNLSVMIRPNAGENKDILSISISKDKFHQS
jgi:hypothetical protein